MFIFRILHAVPYSNQKSVCDVTAKLHAYFTCNLLIGLSILLSYKQFGGNPIECMTPLGFSSAWNEYVENYCFSADTYYVSFNNQIVDFSPEQKKSLHISYYQWMPFFLLFQCACFKFPTFLWKYLAARSGVKVGEVLRLATNEANAEPAARADNLRSLCSHLQGALRFQDRLKKRKLTPHRFLLCLNLKYSSHYISCIYFFTKFIFLLNVFSQTALLNKYLFPSKGPTFGFSVWRNLLGGDTTWRESGLFPRVTLCDFEVREMGNFQNHTIQCVLLLNIFTEKVFVVLWAWYIVLAAFTLCNFTSWLMLFANRRFTEHFVFNHLEMSGERIFESPTPTNCSLKHSQEVQTRVSRFIRKYLKSDGTLILRLIAQHADVVFTTELVYRLWESHNAIEEQIETLRRTEKPWREHLRRFEKMRRRAESSSIAENQNDYAVMPYSSAQKKGGNRRSSADKSQRLYFGDEMKNKDATDTRHNTHDNIRRRRQAPGETMHRTKSMESVQDSQSHSSNNMESETPSQTHHNNSGKSSPLKRPFFVL